jgi:hypothetical protein
MIDDLIEEIKVGRQVSVFCDGSKSLIERGCGLYKYQPQFAVKFRHGKVLLEPYAGLRVSLYW